jgi:hypothetical protein
MGTAKFETVMDFAKYKVDVAIRCEGCRYKRNMPAEQFEAVFGIATRLAEVRRLLLKNPAGATAAAMLKKHKRDYERHSEPRNLIAHSHCGGVWTNNPDYIVFATFKREGEGLAIDAVPLDQIERATIWALAMAKVALESPTFLTPNSAGCSWYGRRAVFVSCGLA